MRFSSIHSCKCCLELHEMKLLNSVSTSVASKVCSTVNFKVDVHAEELQDIPCSSLGLDAIRHRVAPQEIDTTDPELLQIEKQSLAEGMWRIQGENQLLILSYTLQI